MFKSHAHRTMDMTEGSLLTKVLFFSLPIMLSGILQLLFNAADTIVVGRFAGNEALAAVGSVGSLNNMIISLFVGLSIGVNVLVARFTGAKDAELRYQKCGEADGLTLVRVRLFTGRSHQIRVQLSHAGLPIWGDARYGGGKPGEQIALWGAHLGLIHPTKKEEMRFDALPPMDAQPWKRFDAAVWAREGKIFL